MTSALTDLVDQVWDDEIVPALHDYIAIPNVSVLFDPQWREHGHMARAVELIRAWCADRKIAGLTVEVHELPGRTPMILMEIPAFGSGSADDTVLLYGHLDKQPEMTGWREDLGPWKPVVEGDRLYGRGGADDGYAAFASKPARRAAVPTCRLTSRHWPTGSVRRASCCASIPVASITTGCGSRPLCVAWSVARCVWRS
jgi:hypothetical protein